MDCGSDNCTCGIDWKELRMAKNKREYNTKTQEEHTLKINKLEQEIASLRKSLPELEGRTKETWIAVILDESGSMKPYTATTISAINEYFEDRIKDAKILIRKC
jgi:hypothetical protein